MRGLTNEERAVLSRWQAGIYEGFADASPRYETMCQLFARGLGADAEMVGPFGAGTYATCTPLGALALRADAAARAAGVWP